MATITVIPRPVSVKYEDGVFVGKGVPAISGDPLFTTEMAAALSQYWGTNADHTGTNVICKRETVFTGAEKSAEGYRLRVARDGITLSASTGAGCYNGLQTLRQLFLSENHGDTVSIPCALIEDYPRFSWRGYLFDSSRHFFPPAVIKQMMDAISLHHINRFHWHLTDSDGWRFPVTGYPLLTEVGSHIIGHGYDWEMNSGWYTTEDLKELVCYASARNIEIIPEVDFPGHSDAVIQSYSELGCAGARHVLCAGNDGLFDLAAAVFDSLIELFPSQYIHIGGDEVDFTFWDKCPKCRKRRTELGFTKTKELQSWITYKLVGMLEERGKTAIGWDEILEDTEQFRLPENAVVMSWRGWANRNESCDRGYKTIMCPTNEGCYFDYKFQNIPEEMGVLGTSKVVDSYKMDPIKPGMTEKEAALVLGGQGNLWTEVIRVGREAEYMTFPRICALSEALWTPKDQKDYDDFKNRLVFHKQRLDVLNLLYYRGSLE
jgi:hexosaminidase